MSTIVAVSSTPHRGLIVDFYGVLTDGMNKAMQAWTEADDIEYSQFRDAMAEWFGNAGSMAARFNPVHALERGELEVPDFEERLAARLQRRDGSPVEPRRLLSRMFSRFEHAPDMAGLVRRARKAGIRTALLSNSWGDQYLRWGWADMFDAVVISGEVGMRKPERRIFDYTLRQLDLDASSCVFVDDHDRNVRTAVDMGMVGILHLEYQLTAVELGVLFDLPLA
jgi:epoxide hydrolase-like predicted phosphatase